MQPTVYESKIDLWIILVFLAASIAIIAALVQSVGASSTFRLDNISRLAVPLVMIFLLVVVIWLPVLNTKYTIDANGLVVRSGVFKWTIPLQAMLRIERTRDMSASPALSLDRLRIIYDRDGEQKVVMISPKNQADFCSALNRKIIEVTGGASPFQCEDFGNL